MRSRSRLVVTALAAVAASVVPLAVSGTVTTPAAQGATALTITPSADSFTQYASPSANAGTSLRWSLDGRTSVARRAYLQFTVPVLPTGVTITGAALSAYVETDGASSGPGPVVHRTSAAWTETGLTWSNQPALGAEVAVTTAPYAAGTWVRWDVLKGLTDAERTGGRVLAFALTTAEKKWLGFRSRESAQRPHLVLTLSDSSGTSPAPSIEAATVRSWGPVVAGDEFGYTGAPASTKWNLYKSAGHAGNGVRSPAAWSVDGSVATVVGDEVGTTGGMSARFARQLYGRWEVRMRTSARDPEYHPVLLLWPDTATSTCPEIDFAEGASDTGVMSFYQHYGCGSLQTWARMSIDTTEWHNYAVEWTPAGVTGFVDGVPWFSDSNVAHLPPGSMHLAAQLDWFPDGTATRRSWMQLDWVRVYSVT